MLIAAGFLVMLAWTWGKGGDLLVDFGRELYVPWRLMNGETLYTDIAYFNGPLSPYLNSLWFRLFGPSISTILAANLAILAGLTVLLYRLLAELADHRSATIACLLFITVFAFGHADKLGNYNYLTPYSHEAPHGVALALLALFLVVRARHWRHPLLAFCVAGIAFGLCFLCKPEIFLAAALALPFALGSTAVRMPQMRLGTQPGTGIFALTFLAAVLTPPLAAFVLLALAMPPEQALRGVMGAWYWIAHRNVFSHPFYSHWMGISQVGDSLTTTAAWAARYTAVLAPALLFSFVFGSDRKRQWLGAALGLLPLVLLAYWYATDFNNLARPLLFVMVAMAFILMYLAARHRQDPRRLSRHLFQLGLVVFSGALLAKMALFNRIGFYGFVLAMPASMVVVLTLTRWIPVTIDRAGGSGRIFRLAGIALVLLVAITHLGVSHVAFALYRSYTLVQGPNRILSDSTRGPLAVEALQYIASRTRPQDTLCVFPRGMMLNFLAQRACIKPYYDFHPFELFLYGEDRVLRSLQSQPPDYVMLAHLPMREEGTPFFGQHYARHIHAWIQSNYEPVRLFGVQPFLGDDFGILLLRHTDANASPAKMSTKSSLGES